MMAAMLPMTALTMRPADNFNLAGASATEVVEGRTVEDETVEGVVDCSSDCETGELELVAGVEVGSRADDVGALLLVDAGATDVAIEVFGD